MMEADLFFDSQLYQNVSYPTAPALWIRYEMPLHHHRGTVFGKPPIALFLDFIFRELPCAFLGHRLRAAQYLAAQGLALD
jgi:hypothetical protein